MKILILITMVGVNLAPLLFPRLDQWYATGMWSQLCILTLYSASFFEIPKYKMLQNIPLGLLHLWIALLTAFVCYQYQVLGKMNVYNFYPYFNFLCILVFYQIIVQYLNIKDIEMIMGYLRYALIATCLLCTLQYFGLAQFFKMFDVKHGQITSPVIGMIGNGTHLSGFLAMCSPLLFDFKRENLLSLGLLFLLLFFTATTIFEPSISGFVIFFILAFLYSLRVFGKCSWIVFAGIGVVSLGLIFLCGNTGFFSDNGRVEAWVYYWNLVQKNFITGVGLGKINEIYKMTPFPQMRHLHLEYYHFLFEIGFIGFILILNLIVDFFKKEVFNDTHFKLKLMIIGFLLSSCFNYPAHLWLVTMVTMFAYASFTAIHNQEILYGSIE